MKWALCGEPLLRTLLPLLLCRLMREDRAGGPLVPASAGGGPLVPLHQPEAIGERGQVKYGGEGV